MQWIALLQWPAMIVTVVAAWLAGSQKKSRRQYAFWCFLASNVLWVAWGWYARAWALLLLQVFLAVINIRGVKKNAEPT